MYSAYGIAIDGERSWKFGNELAKNVIIFSIHNSSLSHADNRKNNFLIFSEDPTYGINGSFGSPEKNFGINLSKQTQNFPGVCIIMVIIVICLLMEKKPKADNKNFNFPTQFCFGSITNGFSATESREASLKGYVYDFLVDYNSIDKSDILNIRKYLMVNDNIKQCSGWLNKCLSYY